MSMNRIFAASRSALQTQKANAALFKSAMKPMAVKGKLSKTHMSPSYRQRLNVVVVY